MSHQLARRSPCGSRLKVFTNHETRDTKHVVLLSRPKPGQPVFHESRPVTKLPESYGRAASRGLKGHETRITKHESRITKHGLYASLPTISHDFPAFPGIIRPPPPPNRSRVRPPSTVLGGPQDERRLLEIPQKCTKSRIPQENAQSTALACIAHHAARRSGCGSRLKAFTSLHFSPRGEAKCVRGSSGRGARRLARAGVLDSTLSTASKRNEVLAVVSCASTVGW